MWAVKWCKHKDGHAPVDCLVVRLLFTIVQMKHAPAVLQPLLVRALLLGATGWVLGHLALLHRLN